MQLNQLLLIFGFAVALLAESGEPVASHLRAFAYRSVISKLDPLHVQHLRILDLLDATVLLGRSVHPPAVHLPSTDPISFRYLAATALV